MTYTNENLNNIERLKVAIKEADAILIGAGAGLSTSAGLTYNGERFMKYFADFHDKYGINDMYSGGFYPYKTLEEYWAWWSRHIYYNRFAVSAGKPHLDLLKLVQGKEYFVLTTNVDHQFQIAGFDKSRLFYTQGDYGLFQCSVPCHDKTYDNEAVIREMVKRQVDMKIPSELIPRCPKCGKPMIVNLRCDNRFVEDDGWRKASRHYADFAEQYGSSKLLLLELGVGGNTPVIIKYPFWKMTMKNRNAVYACINYGESICPKEIKEQSICINGDIFETLSKILKNESITVN